jgi:hypothetical protein
MAEETSRLPEVLMEKAVGFLTKAVATTAAVALLQAIVLMIASRSLFALPLLALAVVAGLYSLQVRAGRRHSSEDVELRQRILVS